MVTRNLPVSGAETSEDCCIKFSDVKCAEESYLNDDDGCPHESSSPPACNKNFNEDDIMHTLSGFYGGVLVAIVVATMLMEFNHKSVPHFFIHDYLFICFLVVGILLSIGGVFLRYRSQVVPYHTDSEVTVTKEIGILVKIGTAISGFVVVFASILELASILSSERCLSYGSAFHPMLRSVFVLIQIYFLKCSVGISDVFGCFQNVTIMHFLATNVALWIRCCLWELAKDWDSAEHLKRSPSIDIHNSNLSFTVHSIESDIKSTNASLHSPVHVVHYTTVCYFQVKNPETMDMTSLQYCLQNSLAGILMEKTNQYMYLLMTQYYILISSCLYVMWQRNKCKRGKSHHKNQGMNRNLHCSTKGLFLGSVVLSASIIVLIISFSVKKDLTLMLHSIYCVNFVLSSFSAVIGLFQMRSIYTWISNKDIEFIRTFQKIGLTAVFIYGSCNVIYGSLYFEKVHFFTCFEAASMILHGITQYLFIIQASKKKPDGSNVQCKPGCQSVVFLIFCNFSLWILDCFVIWNHMHVATSSVQLWSVITRCIFPLVVFYRFHTFASLFDIWYNTYK